MAGRGVSEAYRLLGNRGDLVDEEILRRRLSELASFDAFGAGDFVYLVAYRGSHSLVQELFAGTDWLRLRGPSFQYGACYPTLAAVALVGLSHRDISSPERRTKWWFRVMGLCTDAIRRLHLPIEEASSIIGYAFDGLFPHRPAVALSEAARRRHARDLLPLVRQLRSWFAGLGEPPDRNDREAYDAQLVQLDRLIHRMEKLARGQGDV